MSKTIDEDEEKKRFVEPGKDSVCDAEGIPGVLGRSSRGLRGTRERKRNACSYLFRSRLRNVPAVKRTEGYTGERERKRVAMPGKGKEALQAFQVVMVMDKARVGSEVEGGGWMWEKVCGSGLGISTRASSLR